jgi:hypothetical protein
MTKQTITLPVTGTPISSSNFGIPVKNTIDELWQGTTAGDMDYYLSSTEKERLAKGAARQAMKINAAGTFPEWGSAVHCRVKNDQNQAITKDTSTYITFTSEETDTDGMWSSGSPTQIVAPYTGVYLVTIMAAFETNSTGVRLLNGTMGGNQAYESRNALTGVSTSMTLTYSALFNAGNIINFSVWQNSGGTIALNSIASITLLV